MKGNTLIWICRQIRRRIPAVLLLAAAEVGHSLFSVYFALGSRGVIDSAVAGQKAAFYAAVLHQAEIIFGILICLTVAAICGSVFEQIWNGIGKESCSMGCSMENTGKFPNITVRNC